jgi:hypothetical protein
MNKLLHNFEDHSESSISTDFTLAEGTKNSLPTSILIMLDATHSGYRNKNFFHYDTDAMRYAVSKDVWTSPFPKPFLKNHDLDSEPLGRVQAARFIDSADGKGFTQLDVLVTDKDAIEKIIDGRYLTVSTHGAPLKDAIADYNFTKCSICNINLNIEDYCGHSRGRVYEDEDGIEKQCFWIVGALDYKEVSIVNTPADNDGTTAAQITGVSMIDGENPASPCKGDSCQVQKSMVFIDSEVNYASETFLDACDILAELLVANKVLWKAVKYNKQTYIDQKGLLYDEDIILAKLEKKELQKIKESEDCTKLEDNENSQELKEKKPTEPIVTPKDYMTECCRDQDAYLSSDELGGLAIKHSHVVYYEDELKNGYTDWVLDHSHSVVDGKILPTIIRGTEESHDHQIGKDKIEVVHTKMLLDYKNDHRHVVYINAAGNGHASYVDGHSHEVVNNKILKSNANHIHKLVDWPDDLNDFESEEGVFTSLNDLEALKEKTSKEEIKNYYDAVLKQHQYNNNAFERYQYSSIFESIDTELTDITLLIGNEAMKQLNDLTLEKLNKTIDGASTEKVERIKLLIENNSKISDDVKQAFLEAIKTLLQKAEEGNDAEDAAKNNEDTDKNSPADLVEALKIDGMDSYMESVKDESFKDGYKTGYEEASVAVSLDDSSKSEEKDSELAASEQEDTNKETNADTDGEEQNTKDEEQSKKEIEEVKNILIDSIVHSVTALRKSEIDLENIESSKDAYKASLADKNIDELRDLYKELDKDMLDAFVNVPSEALNKETISEDKPEGLNDNEKPMSDTKKVITSYFKSK